MRGLRGGLQNWVALDQARVQQLIELVLDRRDPRRAGHFEGLGSAVAMYNVLPAWILVVSVVC